MFIGRDWGKERSYSERTAETIDMEVRRLVEEAEKKAVTLLTKNRKVLTKLAEILLEKEVVEGYELDKLLGLKPVPVAVSKTAPGLVIAPTPAPA